MHREKNNKGLTLVELIVTVAILAILVLPLLKAFVISASTNAKAKEKLRTTELAQNIMEGLNATDLAHVAYQFNYPGTDNCDFTLLSGQKDIAVQEMREDGKGNLVAVTKADDLVVPDYIVNPEKFLAAMNITSSVVKYSGETNGTFVGQADGNYYFAMENLTASEKNYDALIKITANRDTADNDTTNNAGSLVSISSIDSAHDALSIPEQTADDVMQEIQENQADIARHITVSIEEISENANVYTRVTVSYTYTRKTDGTQEKVSSSDVIFENVGEEDRTLSDVYLFFYPWYTSTQSNPSDMITIENAADQDICVYLVKQESGAANQETLEDGYRVKVDVVEPYNSVSDTTANTGVRTNLDQNQVTWLLNGVTVISNADGKININDLSAKETQDTLFDVTVEIYPTGSYENRFKDAGVITSLTGGMLN